MYDYSMEKDNLKQKFLQLFILGYEKEIPSDTFFNLVQNGLGGIIFFAENLKSRKNFKLLTNKFKKIAPIIPFLSIDQEGGLVERTIFLDEKIEYLTPKALSNIYDEKKIKQHYEILAKDLLNLGINMNFAPVLDVNTNPNNPVIGIRSFGNTPTIVKNLSDIVAKTFSENHIINCAKHFAGHGNTNIDSHINMPFINEEFGNFYRNHLCCFENAIKQNIDTIMVSHVHFDFFNEIKTPASLSKNAIEIYLKQILKFNGLILSDDMVMGGISKHYGLKESIILALEAGINMLIFKDCSQELLIAIDEITKEATHNKKLQAKIIENYNKIINFKEKKLSKIQTSPIDINKCQQNIDEISKDTIRIIKKGNLIPLPQNKHIKIISFEKKNIYNLSANKYNLSDFLTGYNIEEIHYPLDPSNEDIEKILKSINNEDIIIFLSYNAHLNKGQIKLFNTIINPKILLSCALDYDIEFLENSDSIIATNCPKNSSLKSVVQVLQN